MANSRISREKQEKIISVYAMEGSINKAAKAANVSWGTARRYIERADNDKDLANIRDEKKKEIIEKGWANIVDYMNLMREKAPGAKLREVTGAFAQTVEKMQLLSGEATEINKNEHSGTMNIQDSRLAGLSDEELQELIDE